MVIKIGRYTFGTGKIKKELCPLCLEKIDKGVHFNCFPKGRIAIKRQNYVLFKIGKDEPIVKKMLTISRNKKDNSKEFIIFYIDKTFVGYKGEDKIWFIPNFSKAEYKKILIEYAPRSKHVESAFENYWKLKSGPSMS